MSFKKINPKYQNLLFCLAIIATVFIAYGNTISHDYNLDDVYYIDLLPDKNASIDKVFTVFKKRFYKNTYRPIPAFHLAIEQSLFGQNPAVFHLFNLFYYALLGIILFFLFRKLKIFPHDWLVLGFVVFFLLHPSHSNVVASIKNRDVILTMFYGLLGVSLVVKSFDTKNYFYLTGSLVLFTVAMLCKLDGFLYVIMAGIVLYFTRNIKPSKVVFSIALILIGTILTKSLLTNFLTESAGSIATTDFFENSMVENKGEFKKLLISSGLSVYYHKFMVIPFNYHFYFGYNQIPIPKTNSLLVIVMTLIYAVIFIGLIISFLKKKKNNCLLGLTIYGLFLAPFIIRMNSTAGIIAVRYSFHASLGLSLIVISVFYYFYNTKQAITKFLAVGIISTVLIISTYFTLDRNKDWKNQEALLTHDLQYLKNAYVPNKIGGIYFRFLDKDLKVNNPKSKFYRGQSLKYLNRAKKVYNKDAELYKEFGLLYWKEGNYKNAFVNLKEAVKLDSTNVETWNYYGNFNEFIGDNANAEAAYKQVVKLDRDSDVGYKNLTFALLKQQKIDEAIALNSTLIKGKEMQRYGFENLGHIYIGINDTSNAIYNFNKAFEHGLKNNALQKEINQFSK